MFVQFGLFNSLSDDRQVYLPMSIGSNKLNSTAQRSVLKIYGDGIANKASNTLGNTSLSTKSIAIGGWSGGGTASQVLKVSLAQVFILQQGLKRSGNDANF